MSNPVGFFGGTFDPVHRGHIHAAKLALAALGLDVLRLVLAAEPSHRGPPGAAAADRWAMLCLAVQDEPGLVADDRELRHGGPSYTVETLERARSEYGAETPLVWLVGWDAFCRLDSWRRWQRLPTLAHLAVLRRPGLAAQMSEPVRRLCEARRVDDGAALRTTPAGAIYVLDAEMLAISATDIRAALQRGRLISHLLPAPVWTYIYERQLYRGSPHR